MFYVEVLKKRYNNVGRTFCDAINPQRCPYSTTKARRTRRKPRRL